MTRTESSGAHAGAQARAGALTAARFGVRLTPRGGRDALDGAGEDGLLHVRVAAPPAEGAANRALVKLLASSLRVPASGIAIESGASSRTKRLRVDGASPDTLMTRWPGLAARPG